MSHSDNSGSSSIEDIQDSFDELVLSIFEAVRSHDQDSNAVQPSQNVLAINTNYEKVKNHINNLRGLNISHEEQSKQYEELCERYKTLRSETLALESNLYSTVEKIDTKLTYELSDAAIGLKQTLDSSNITKTSS